MIQYLRGRIIILCIAAVGALGFWYIFGTVSLPNAHFTARSVLLNPSWDGQIAELLVKQGDFVRKGQSLVRLDSRAQEARLQTATTFLAALNEAKQLTTPLNVEQLTQKINALQTRAEGMRKEENVGREHIEAQGLVHVQKTLALRALDTQTTPAKGSVRKKLLREQREARDALSQVRVKFEVLSRARVQAELETTKARDALTLAKKRQQSSQSQKYLYTQMIAEAQQQEAFAIKAVAAAQLAVDTALVVASIDGRIMMLDGIKGDYVTPSKPLVRVQGILPPDVWVTATFHTVNAPHLELDMPVIVQTAGKSSITLNGRIAEIEMIVDAVVIQVELVDFSPEDIAFVQHDAPVSAWVPWWGILQAFVF